VEAHAGWVRAVAVSPDGATVASCGNDHLVKLWSAEGSFVRSLAGHECHVYNLAFHPAGTRLVSCDLKGVVMDWDWRSGRCVRELDARPLHKYDGVFRADIGGARGMAFDPTGNRLAVCGITNVANAFAGVGNPLVMTFDWVDGKSRQLRPAATFQGTAWGVGFHPSGAILSAGGGSGGQLWVWTGDEGSTHTGDSSGQASGYPATY
jgi:WD40 repeat protein